MKLIPLILLLAGCAPGALLMPDVANLTPEQIKAVGYDGIRCATIAGPPPTGRTTLMTVPKDRKVRMKMGNNCEMQEVIIEPESK